MIGIEDMRLISAISTDITKLFNNPDLTIGEKKEMLEGIRDNLNGLLEHLKIEETGSR